MLRRDDLLALDFQCFNLALEGGGGSPPQLVQKDSAQPAFLVAQFNSPQNIAEQAYLEACADTTPPHQPPPSGSNPPDPQSLQPETPDSPGAVQTRAAGPSRLAFQLPSGTTAVPYSLDGLLNWVALQQSIVPVAAVPDTRQEDPNQQIVPRPQAPAQTPQIQQPTATETAIEAPWRLFLSPNYSGAWAHSSTPVTLSNRTELWHTRLAVRTLQGNGFTADETIPRRVRAVWSPDYTTGAIPGHPPPFGSDATPFRMSLDPDDRDQIVRLSSDFTMSVAGRRSLRPDLDSRRQVVPQHARAPGSRSSAIGRSPTAAFGQLDLQRATVAASSRAGPRQLRARCLCRLPAPVRQRRVAGKVTERKLQSINGGPTTAYLRQKFFIIVRQPTMSYQFADRRTTTKPSLPIHHDHHAGHTGRRSASRTRTRR